MTELVLYPNRFWQIGKVFKDSRLIATINKFYEIEKEWILIYDEVGGSGYGYRKGNLIQKIFIGDSELKTVYKHD